MIEELPRLITIERPQLREVRRECRRPRRRGEVLQCGRAAAGGARGFGLRLLRLLLFDREAVGEEGHADVERLELRRRRRRRGRFGRAITQSAATAERRPALLGGLGLAVDAS